MTQQRARVTLSGDIHAEGVVRDGRPHGEPVIAPETEWGAMLARAEGRDATPGEVADVLREHEHEMLPLDDDS
jgi:hypothetical protein